MSSAPPASSSAPSAPPNVLLRGGPDHVTSTKRVRYVPDPEATLKLEVGNTYEHFEPTAETAEHEGRPLRVLRWTRRTYVAE
ncbi:hypothetical protein E0L36_15410 [Streptomyces sp. AJS327]|nr:hypothetical protein [Streptomyces sp. AJS327]